LPQRAGGNDAHGGDGVWFYEDWGAAKNGKARAVALDREGNVIMVVHHCGWFRRVRFLPVD